MKRASILTVFAATFLFFGAAPVFAEETVWEAGSTHLLDGASVELMGGDVLTVEPGAIVENGTFVINGGTLVVAGTEGEPVVLQEVYLQANSGVLELRNVQFVFQPNAAYPIQIDAQTEFIHENVSIEGDNIFQRGFVVTGTISSNTTWVADNVPYVVSRLAVEENATLTVEAGAVIKTDGFGLSNAGTVDVRGTALEPVYITAIFDSSVGGDTVGDAFGGEEPKAECAIESNGGPAFSTPGVLALDYAVVRNAIVGVCVHGGDIRITNSTFDDNDVAFDGEPGSLYVANSTVNGELWHMGGEEEPEPEIPEEPQPFDPVIIIPGILGSWEKNGRWILDPVTHVYDNLVDTFLANGYVEGETLFTFPYDWRQSNVLTAAQLADKVADVREVCACGKVDLIGHSMGGLVASEYVRSDNYGNDVDQLFLVATPLKGAPYAYKTWEGGELGFEPWYYAAIANVVFSNEARKHGFGIKINNVTVSGDIFSYMRGWPITSIQELLPVHHNYLSADDMLAYPFGYPINSFLETLTANFKVGIVDKVNLKVLRAELGAESTLASLVVASSTELDVWEHGEPIDEIYDFGDGTVPRWSIEEIVPADKEFFGVDHNAIVTASESYLFTEMTGIEPDVLVNENRGVDVGFLVVQLFSPIDMQIVAPDGKRLGKDFATGEELSEIPDAFYSGFVGDNEYAIILNPLPGEYRVETVGTGNGAYTVVADYVSSSASSTREVSGMTAPAQENEWRLSLAENSGLEVVPPPAEEEPQPGGEQPPKGKKDGKKDKKGKNKKDDKKQKFTDKQVAALTGCLRAFGVDERVVSHVGSILQGWNVTIFR